jgi:hypothetical protein
MRSVMAILLGTLAGSAARAATLVVPTEYPTIHAAMAVAGAGDTVLVEPGTYDDFEVRPVFGNWAALGFLVDGVTLLSEAGPEATVLHLGAGDGLAPSVTGLWIGGVGSGETRVRGFKINGAPVSGAFAIVASSAQNVVISECIFELDDPSSGTAEHRSSVKFIVSSGRIEDCLFSGCRGPGGAGLFLNLGGTMEIERTVFENCKNEAMRETDQQMTVVRECVFESNVSLDFTPGAIAGISPGIVENCVFRGNEGGDGGALVGGNLTLRGCLFDSNNTTGSGAALRLGAFGNNVIENNTIVRSMQTVSTLPGSAIVFVNSPNSVLRNNIIAYSSGSPAIRVIGASVPSECNVFWENVDGIGVNFVPGPTDRQVDPLFCDPDASDWTLREGSPCLPEDPFGCGLIGAFPQGCGVISVEGASWGEIKNRYRDAQEVR